jgi:hypothetical protein
MSALNTPKFFLVTGISSGASPVAMMMHRLGVYMGKNFFKLPGSNELSGEDYRARTVFKKFYQPMLTSDALDDAQQRSARIAIYNCVGKLIEEKDETWRSSSEQHTFPYVGLKIPPFVQIAKIISSLISGELFLINCVRDRESTFQSIARNNPNKTPMEVEDILSALEKKREELLRFVPEKNILNIDYTHALEASKLTAYRIIAFGKLGTKYSEVKEAVQHIYNYRDEITVETAED